MRTLRKMLITSLIILFATIVLAEAVLHVTNSIYPLERPGPLMDTYKNQLLEGEWLNGITRFYTYEPNTDGTTYGHPFHVNRWGVRGRDFLERDLEGEATFRIMVLGDSVTSGIGIAEEDRYTNVLETKLHERYPRLKIEIISLGVQGFETLQEERMMYRMWSSIRPNLAIVGFYINDPNVTYDHYLPYKIQVPEFILMLLKRSLLFRQVEPLYDVAYRKFKQIPSFKEVQDRAYNSDSRDWKVFERSVHNIGNWVREHTGQAPVVIFLADVEAARIAGKYEGVRNTFIRERYIWCEIEPGNYFPVSRFENHPNEKSHSLYADALFKTIVEHNLIPER